MHHDNFTVFLNDKPSQNKKATSSQSRHRNPENKPNQEQLWQQPSIKVQDLYNDAVRRRGKIEIYAREKYEKEIKEMREKPKINKTSTIMVPHINTLP